MKCMTLSPRFSSRSKMTVTTTRLSCITPNVYTKVPDGGWGWIVAFAFFFVEALTYGIIKSFGIFFTDLMQSFDETNSRISWIISICVFVLTFTGEQHLVFKKLWPPLEQFSLRQSKARLHSHSKGGLFMK